MVIVHDLIAWKRPDLCRPVNVVHFRALLGASVRRASCIVVPTATVKSDLARTLKVPQQKIHVVPWGVDFEIAPAGKEAARAAVRDHFGVDSPFVLFVGCLERKKNLPALVEATRRIKTRLVVAGPVGPSKRAGLRTLEGTDSDHCRYLGYVAASQLGALYSAAEVFAFPSHMEGFGLPVVEAMACGAPVVASDTPALREVCGGAAILVPPHDVDALAQSLRNVFDDPTLHRSLVHRGRQRALDFTWDRSTRLFWQAVEQTVEQGTRGARRRTLT